MKILVVSNNYPCNNAPYAGIFVFNIIQEFVKLGNEVTVISGRNTLKSIGSGFKNSPLSDETAKVYYPKSISVSNKEVFGFNTHHIGEYFSVRALKRIVNDNQITFDLIYAHFLVNGIVAVKALAEMGKPIFVAEGEFKNINLRRSYYSPGEYSNLLSKITGFIAVSPQIKDNLVKIGVPDEDIIIKPNAVDFDRFYPRDKMEMRRKYDLPIDKKLVVFVGRFVEDKGPIRVLRAIEQLDNVSGIFLGGGPQEFESEHIAFKEKVTPEKVPELLSAADVFVLPTLHEGSCNAIVEAMACGLPVVSSDIPEIQFQCDPSCSILVDPMNVKDLSQAIDDILCDIDRFSSMKTAALSYSRDFSIINRAMDILRFIDDKVQKLTEKNTSE